jgi:transmembrane sensor
VRFVDGSSVELSGTTSSIEVHEVSANHIVVELENGGGHFSVTPRDNRRFAVHAGAVDLLVMGTEFDVRLQGARTWVAVSEGVVRVDWPNASATLEAGARGMFPPEEAAPLAESTELADAGEVHNVDSTPHRPSARAASPRETYRKLVEGKDYAGAFRILEKHPGVVGNTVANLMLAADVARLTGHPTHAIPYLRRVVDHHRGHPQAPLAAFTLGRIYVGLGRHDRAEQLFAMAGGMAPQGQLAEDALVRQISAAARAGDRVEARRLAREYLRRFPNGRRQAEVKKQAGL